MTIKDIAIEQLTSLSDEKVSEVLDFIGYLKQKEERAEWADLMIAQQTSLAPVWDNNDDEVWNDL